MWLLRQDDLEGEQKRNTTGQSVFPSTLTPPFRNPLFRSLIATTLPRASAAVPWKFAVWYPRVLFLRSEASRFHSHPLSSSLTAKGRAGRDLLRCVPVWARDLCVVSRCVARRMMRAHRSSGARPALRTSHRKGSHTSEHTSEFTSFRSYPVVATLQSAVCFDERKVVVDLTSLISHFCLLLSPEHVPLHSVDRLLTYASTGLWLARRFCTYLHLRSPYAAFS